MASQPILWHRTLTAPFSIFKLETILVAMSIEKYKDDCILFWFFIYQHKHTQLKRNVFGFFYIVSNQLPSSMFQFLSNARDPCKSSQLGQLKFSTYYFCPINIYQYNLHNNIVASNFSYLRNVYISYFFLRNIYLLVGLQLLTYVHK